MSAFNLSLTRNNKKMSVECAFQGSKVFENGGPYVDLYGTSSLDAKRDDRIRNSGEIIAFDFMGVKFPTIPITLFYDWLYITALHQNKKLSEGILAYDGFTDIAFNPQKSWNCQARSAALYLALHTTGKIEQVISDTECYLKLSTGTQKPHTGGVQMGFGFE